MGDMQIPQRFGFHDWYKNKKGREFPHGYSQIHRMLSGQTDTIAKRSLRISKRYLKNTKQNFLQ